MKKALEPLVGVVDTSTILEKEEGKKKKRSTTTASPSSSYAFVPKNKAFEKVRKLHAQMEEMDKEIKMLRHLAKLLKASEEICMKYNKMALDVPVDKKRKRQQYT